MAGDAGALAAALRTLIGDTTGTGTSLTWTVGPASLTVDLASGALNGTAEIPSSGVVPAIAVTVTASPAGADATVALGELDPERGGVRLVASGGSNAAPAIAAEVAAAGAPAQRVALFPFADPAAVARLAAAVVPAAISTRLIDQLRSQASTDGAQALDAALDLLGILGETAPNGTRPTLLPIGLFLDPVGWLRHGVTAWRTAFATSAVAFLDLLGGVVVAGSTGAWQITPEFAVRYEALGQRLRLRAAYTDSITTGASTVTTAFAGGVDLALDTLPSPVVDVSVAVDGHGVRLTVDPSVRLDLVRPAPRPAVALYPAGSGIGDIASAAGGMVAPLVLNALIAHRDNAGSSLTIDAARVAYDLGAALDLLEADLFTATRIEAFATDPGTALLARLPQVAASGVARLAAALDPAGTLVAATTPGAGRTRLAFGTMGSVAVLLDASGALPAVELSLDVAIAGVGRIVVERIRLSADGVQVAARIGPAAIDLGPVTLFPLVVIHAGVSSDEFTRAIGIGLATDAAAATSVEFRWTLDATPPSLALITRAGLVESLVDDPLAAALQLVGAAASIAAGILINELDSLFTDRVTGWLQGVVFTDSPGSVTVDPTVFTDVLDPAALFNRLLRLGWNVATVSPPSITIDGTVTIGLVANGPASNRRLGINLSVPPNRRFTLASGDTKVELEVDAAWIDPSKPAGLTIELLSGTISSLQFAPGVIVAGVGVRISKQAGPVLDLGGVAIDAIAIHTYAEANSAGQLGGGVELQLDGFAFSPRGGGGDNAVANGMLNDAGGGRSRQPSGVQPGAAVQERAGRRRRRVGRAGDAARPVVGRGPAPARPDLHRAGRPRHRRGRRARSPASRCCSTAACRCSAWRLRSTSCRSRGTAATRWRSRWRSTSRASPSRADMSGVTLAGGLLKTDVERPVGYIGMLLGRFGVYGLSVFGGYADRPDGHRRRSSSSARSTGRSAARRRSSSPASAAGSASTAALRMPSDLVAVRRLPVHQGARPGGASRRRPDGELRAARPILPAAARASSGSPPGISFTSFALVDGIAVVAVQFGDGLEIDLLGLARMALPRPQARAGVDRARAARALLDAARAAS